MQALHMTEPMHDTTPRLPGTWKLAAGRAVTLQPREAGEFRVAHGSVWATFDGPHTGPANGLGDRVLGVGERVRLHAGQRMVIEPWDGSAYFSWDPLPVQSAVSRLAPLAPPLEDLRRAFVIGGGAFVRLGSGLVAIGWHAVFQRRAQRLQEQACNRHGAMS